MPGGKLTLTMLKPGPLNFQAFPDVEKLPQGLYL